MTDALVSFVVKELGAKIKDEVGLLASVEKELECLSSTFSAIQALLVDAERQQNTAEGVRDWLGKIKEVAYEVEDILDEWRTDAFMSQHDEDDIGKILTICFSLFPCLCFKQVKLRHDIGHSIKKVRERLNEISEEKSNFSLKKVNMGEGMSRRNKKERETSSLIDESEIFGRDEVKEEIIRQLVGETAQKKKPISIVSIVGMGGLGKTTVAQQVYNDTRVKTYFKRRIWVCVSDPPDVNRIATKVIKSLNSSSNPNNLDLDTLLRNLHKAVDGKLFLLVLDDVWDENGTLWQKLRVPLKSAAPGSRIVVTTRSRPVAEKMEAIHIRDLGVLSYSDCWKVFHSRALKGTEEENCRELTKIGEKIVGRCKGVPLAAKAVGSLLHVTREKWYWEHVLQSEIWNWDIAKDDIPKDDGILPALLLSYYNLPLHLKRCFSFCSVFPKDHVIEKDELVKLWMAHGIIKSKKAKKDVAEEIGEMYFNYLLTRSLFQDAEKDINGNVVRCKMHDLVHDLATFVSSGDYCSMEAGHSELSSIKCHHLSLLVNRNVSSIPSPPCSAERLRTLLLFEPSAIKEVPDTLFNPLRYLRALDLSGTSIENLPSFIGKVKHLRYLNLCGLEIVDLPESVTELCNLQTLKLNECILLRSLPSGMSKMVELRYLEIKGTNRLTVLPNGLGKMTSLRTLCKFPMGYENRGCKIGELKELNLLRGELSINNLERVMNVKDAREAELHKKTDLHVLSLCCNDKSDEEWRTLGDDEMKRMDSVLEGLIPPHSNLKELKIKNYAGSMFPSWLDSEDSRFSSLVKVVLENCRKCTLLPGLGKLHSLKYLEIIRADEVKVVGCEFYGNDDARVQETRFPKLEVLYFTSMHNWEEWKLNAMPSDGWGLLESLHTLRISHCPELAYLPEGLRQLKALQTLQIWDCEQLSSLFDGFEQLKSLCRLDIWDCPQLTPLPNLQHLTSLERLSIERCPLLTERLEKEKGEDWCKISNIPRIYIDDDFDKDRYMIDRYIYKRHQSRQT